MKEDGLATLDNPPFTEDGRMGHPANDAASLYWLGEDDCGAVGGFVFYGLQGFVGLVEGEDLDLRLDVYFGG